MTNSKMKSEILTLAGGCFWGMEELFRQIPGVIDTEVGYAGGHVESPTYETVKGGKSGHAEALQIEFDPAIVSLVTLLDHFFRLHDPTTLNSQGNDHGSQYRSVIFYRDDAQKNTAEAKIKEVEASAKWARPVVTQVLAFTKFYPAEKYHQDYLQKNPGGYTCHYYRS